MIDRNAFALETAQRMCQSPHPGALGFEVIESIPYKAVIRLPWREELVGDVTRQVMAGGAVTSILDHVCGIAASAIPEVGPGPTLDLRIDYMRPAGPRAAVIARAECYKVARTIAFVRAVAWDVDEDDPIATAQAAFALRSEVRDPNMPQVGQPKVGQP